MGLIHILDTEVSNKIAAGEVVERPLSIVKELVENSIDAGANVITVEMKGGGIQYIRVTDNGCGMSAEDARICFLRHSTSKISEGADLDAIYTLGFRGEALSSIGAVAKVRLYTKRRDDECGICVTCEGGEILSSTDAGAPNGTVMEVSELFYNTPARLKFLKKPATESGYISDLFARYIFAYPEISFKLVRDGKEVLFSSGDNKLMNAVYAVYGKDYARNMLEVDYEYNGISVRGAVGKGTLCRANRGYETFFVNRRYIKSAVMIRALEEAYKNQIMISKFPTAILNIGLDAKLVDINVHPTKLECKFSNEREIYQAVYHAVKSTLYALPNVPVIERGDDKTESRVSGEMRDSLRPSNNFKFKSEHRDTPAPLKAERAADDIASPPPRRDVDTPPPAIQAVPEEPTHAEAASEETLYENYIKRAERLSAAPQKKREEPKREIDTFAMLDYALEQGRRGVNLQRLEVRDSGASTTPGTNNPPPTAENADDAFQPTFFRVIGQLFETYILIEKDDRLLMIDQHAAHERLNYETLKRELEGEGITSQITMIPVEIKLNGHEYEVFSDNADTFSQLGFEASGDDDSQVVTVTAAPGGIGWSDIEPLFCELLTQAENLRQELIAETKQYMLYTISCKAAIKANNKLSEREMRALAESVFGLKNINTCPHGRPIVISMSKKEIEKDFRRIV